MKHKLDSPNKRQRLTPRKKPYYVAIERGIALGYRRTPTGGSWLVRVERDGKRWEKGIRPATDADDDHKRASAEALMLVNGQTETVTDNDKPVTVKKAIENFLEDLVTRGGNPYQAKRLIPRVHAQTKKSLPSLVPAALLDKPVALLTTKELRRFRDDLAKRTPKLVSVNRMLKPLRAALKLAADLSDGRISNRETWRVGLQAYPDMHESKNKDAVWTKDELRRFHTEAAKFGKEFSLFVETKLGTGVRCISILRLQVRDVLPDDELNMPQSLKGLKGQKLIVRESVAINHELAKRLRGAAAGRDGAAPLLVRANGTPWNYSDIREKWIKTMENAKIEKKKRVVTTAARHSSITHMLLDRTADPQLIATSHNTSLLMISRHYADKITKHGQGILRAARLDLTAV